jgi:hypothetical protein
MKNKITSFFKMIFKLFSKKQSHSTDEFLDPFNRENVIEYDYGFESPKNKATNKIKSNDLDYLDVKSDKKFVLSNNHKSNIYNTERKIKLTTKDLKVHYLTQKQYNMWLAIYSLNIEEVGFPIQDRKLTTGNDICQMYFRIVKDTVVDPVIEKWMLRISSHNKTISALKKMDLIRIVKISQNGKSLKNHYIASPCMVNFN